MGRLRAGAEHRISLTNADAGGLTDHYGYVAGTISEADSGSARAYPLPTSARSGTDYRGVCSSRAGADCIYCKY
jgi:hypothetical protein